jgi:hypothetical protein
MERITVILAPEPTRVRMLVRGDGRDLMKAVLGPWHHAHPRAAATLLEGLALWHQRPLGVVVCVDERSDGHALGLFDALGLGERTVHYEVGVAYHRTSRRQSIAGIGDFRDLRHMSIAEAAR